MTDDKIHITLVHGTFATNAPWTKPGSALRESLTKRLGAAVVFHDDFHWPGWACHLSRHRAAGRLREYLLNLTEREPGRHYIIGHSHGGMVALYALRDEILGQRIEGLVTLSTPFLVARRRELSFLGWAAVGISMIAVLLGAGYLVTVPVLRELGVVPTNGRLELTSVMVTLFSGMLGAALAIVVLVVLSLFFHRAMWFFDRTLALPSLHRERVLIVRGPSDEASALMTLFHALELLVATGWGRKGLLDGFITSKRKALSARLESVESSPLMSVFGGWALLGLPVLVGLIGLLVYTRFMQLFHGSEVNLVTFWIVGIEYSAWEYLSGLPSWCLVLGSLMAMPWLLFFGAASILFAVVGALMFPVAAAFCALIISSAMLSLVSVPELGPCAAAIVVSPEAAPPGSAMTCQVDASSSDGILLHSISYTHPAALSAIADAITVWTASGRLSQPVVVPPAPQRRAGGLGPSRRAYRDYEQAKTRKPLP